MRMIKKYLNILLMNIVQIKMIIVFQITVQQQ